MNPQGVISGLFFAASLACPAAVVLEVEEIPTGGVSVTASGTIEIHPEWHWAYDYELDIGQWSRWRTHSFNSGNEIGALGEAWRGLNGLYIPPMSNIAYRSYDLGSFGRGFFVTDDGFNIIYAGASHNNAAPRETTFAFDFVLTDTDSTLSQYTDGQVLWDSNGLAEGGQTITWKVIPEPSTIAFLALVGIAQLARRRPLSF